MTDAQESRSINEAKEFAQKALFDAITQGVKEIREDEAYGVAGRSGALKDLAVVYRLAAGGQQPGGVEVAS